VIFIFPKRAIPIGSGPRQVNSWRSRRYSFTKTEPRENTPSNFDGIMRGFTSKKLGWSEWRNPRKFLPPDAGGKFPVQNLSVETCGLDLMTTRASWSLNRRMDRRCGKTFGRPFISRKRQQWRPMFADCHWNAIEEGTRSRRRPRTGEQITCRDYVGRGATEAMLSPSKKPPV